VDPIGGSDSANGASLTPYQTLSPALEALSSSSGTIIVFNPITNIEAKILRYKEINSQITIKPIFNSDPFVISLHDYDLSSSPISPPVGIQLSTTNGKLILENCIINELSIKQGLQRIFYLTTSGKITLTNVIIKNIQGTENLVYVETGSTASQFLFNEGVYTNSSLTFHLPLGTNTLTNVVFTDIKTSTQLFNCGGTTTLTNIYVSGGSSLFINGIDSISLTIQNITFNSFSGAFLKAVNPLKLEIDQSKFEHLEQKIQDPFITSSGKVALTGTDAKFTNLYFQNVSVRASLFLIEKTQIHHFQNITMTNVNKVKISPQEKIVADFQYESEWTGGVCVLGRLSAVLFIKDSYFNNISSHCIAMSSAPLEISRSTFNNSGIISSEKYDISNKRIINNKNEYDGVTFITIKNGVSDPQPGVRLTINDSQFIENGIYPKYGGVLRLIGISGNQVILKNNYFKGNGALYGGVFYSSNPLSSFETINNTYENNVAINGGVFYKIATTSEKKTKRDISIDDDKFLSNTAIHKGGAIFLDQQAIIVNNSLFLSGHARDGGAIYLASTDLNVQSSLINNTFLLNKASNSGGAVKVLFDYQDLDSFSMNPPNTYTDNTDANQLQISDGKPTYFKFSFYDILTETPETLTTNYFEWIENPNITSLAYSFKLSETPSDLTLFHKSGHSLKQIILVEVYDNNDRIADYINNEVVNCLISDHKNEISKFVPYLLSNPVTFTFQKGRFIMKSNVQLVGEPRTNATLTLSSEREEFLILPDAQLFLEQDFKIYFTDCEVGDIFYPITRVCSTCPVDTYSLADPYSNSACLSCNHRVATCLGGNRMAPKPGFWRYDIQSDNFMECPKGDESCKGGYYNDIYNPYGDCIYPYEGNLCNSCAPDHAKFGSSSTCINCNTDAFYYVKFAGFFGLQILAVLYGVKCNISKISDLKKAHRNEDKELREHLENEDFQSNLMKIAINFFQVSSIIAQFEFKWPEFIEGFVDVTNKFIPSDKDGFSIDCVITKITGSNDNIYFIKLVINLIQPFGLWLLLFLVYLLYLGVSKEGIRGNPNLRKNALVFFIITAFLLQPTIIQNTLESFQCQNFSTSDNPSYYMMGDSQTECWTSYHIFWSLGIAFPFFLLWALVGPIALLFEIRKYAKNLNEPEIHAKYSFLYEGLKTKNYYWEFVTIARKTIIIIAFVFLNFFSVQSQAFATFAIILAFTVLHFVFWPFKDERLNKAELLGLVTLCVMVYSGMFFLSNGGKDWLDIILIIIASGFNVCFFIYLALQFYSALKKKVKRLKARAKIMTQKVKQRIAERNSGNKSGSNKSGSNNSTILDKMKNANASQDVKDISFVLNKIQVEGPGTPGLFNPNLSDFQLQVNIRDFNPIGDNEPDFDLEDGKDEKIPTDEGKVIRSKTVFNEEKNSIDNYSVLRSSSYRKSGAKSFRTTMVSPEMLNDMLNIYNLHKLSITNEFNSSDLPEMGRTFSLLDKRGSPIEVGLNENDPDKIEEETNEEEKLYEINKASNEERKN